MEELHKQNVDQRVNRRKNQRMTAFLRSSKRKLHIWGYKYTHIYSQYGAYFCDISIK